MRQNQRARALLFALLAAALLLLVTVAGFALADRAMQTDFTRTNLAPCAAHPFGTDWMGRDMLARTLTGLSLSIRIGLLTAAVSATLALLLGVAAATLGRRADGIVTYLIDLLLGIPHILLILLVSLACGRGFWGVVAGVSLTHWPSLARVIRGEVLQRRQAPYVLAAQKLGVPRLSIALRHIAPFVLPQFVTGLILQFPHAILHEASITFLGFGLPPEQPAVGVILSESMRYLTTGSWWLAAFPGLALVAVVLVFAALGGHLRRLTDPASLHE